MGFLTSFELGLVVNFAIFVATLVFAQKIKDWLSGVPVDLRKGMKTVEANLLADVKQYQASLLAKITPPAPLVLKAPDPPAA